MLTFFFFNDPATTEIYTLSLHDALPIFTYVLSLSFAFVGALIFALTRTEGHRRVPQEALIGIVYVVAAAASIVLRSEEHTSELQSPCNLVCRLLLEKKNNIST